MPTGPCKSLDALYELTCEKVVCYALLTLAFLQTKTRCIRAQAAQPQGGRRVAIARAWVAFSHSWTVDCRCTLGCTATRSGWIYRPPLHFIVSQNQM